MASMVLLGLLQGPAPMAEGISIHSRLSSVAPVCLSPSMVLFIPLSTALHGAERPGGRTKEVKLLWGRNDTTHL